MNFFAALVGKYLDQIRSKNEVVKREQFAAAVDRAIGDEPAYLEYYELGELKSAVGKLLNQARQRSTLTGKFKVGPKGRVPKVCLLPPLKKPVQQDLFEFRK